MKKLLNEIILTDKRRKEKDIEILGGGVLNFCDKTNRAFIEYLTKLTEEDKGYDILNSSINNIVEFYRVSLYRSLGEACDLPYNMESLEDLVTGCMKGIKPVIEEVKEYDKMGINKYLFIQGCLAIMVRLRNKLKG